MNYWMNMQPYYDVDNLNTYPSIYPAHEKGQQMMDAGRVYFADGTVLDGAKAMAFNNPHARAGLRLMHPEQRPFYRLAVQQAEAAYNIKATHPIFFRWMQDPVGDVNKYAADGMKYGLLGSSSFAGFNLMFVIGAVVGFSKIGRY